MGSALCHCAMGSDTDWISYKEFQGRQGQPSVGQRVRDVTDTTRTGMWAGEHRMGRILCFVQWDGAHRKEPKLREDLEFATTVMTPITRGPSSPVGACKNCEINAPLPSMPSETESESDSQQSP